MGKNKKLLSYCKHMSTLVDYSIIPILRKLNILLWRH